MTRKRIVERLSDERILRIFQSIDTQSNGYIDNETLAAHIIPDSEWVTSENVRLRFAQDLMELCDTSSDGKITIEEFTAFLKGQEKQLFELFQSIDLENDGLCAVDLQKALRASGINVKESEVEGFMKHIDSDNDGIIGFDDWLDFLMFLPNKPNIQNVYRYLLELQSTDSGDPILFPAASKPSLSNTQDCPSSGDGGSGSSSKSSQDSLHANTYKYLFAGGIAGAFSRTVTAPIDRLKILLQISTSPSPRNTKQAMKETLGILKRIYLDGGVLAFWRGNTVNIAKIFPESGIRFFVFESTKRYIVDAKERKKAYGKKQDLAVPLTTKSQFNDSLDARDRLMAGGLAGLVSQAVIYPLETIKTRVMAELNKTSKGNGPVHRRSILEITAEIWKEQGFKGYFRGLGPSLIGIVPYAGIDLTLYETFKRTYSSLSQNQNPSPFIYLACGALSGCISASIVYPLGLIRTRLQAQGTSTHQERYPRGAIDVIERTWKKESWRGFYRGLVPNLVKVVPAVSLSYITYEQVKKVMGLI